MKFGQKFKFYDIKRLIKDYPDAFYYVVFGERSNGKTYSALNYALEKYTKSGEHFAYIRRFGEDIRPKNLSNLFSAHVENKVVEKLTGEKWTSVSYVNNKFYLTRTDEEDGKDERSKEPFGFAFDLNAVEHHKSISYPKVTTIIFDEFMSRSGYLPNEWLLFLNTISTIVRQRNNVKILMLGNTVNKVCPYFTEMGLVHIKNQKQGTVDVYRYGDTDLTVVCEYTESSAKHGGKASDVYFAFDNPELKMITSGSWEIGVYPHLTSKFKPKDILTSFFIDYEEALLQGEIVCTEDDHFIFLHKKTTPIKDETNDVVYVTNPVEKWNYKMCLTKQNDKLSLYIMDRIRQNKIFYSTNEIGEIFRNYLMWSDSHNIRN